MFPRRVSDQFHSSAQHMIVELDIALRRFYVPVHCQHCKHPHTHPLMRNPVMDDRNGFSPLDRGAEVRRSYQAASMPMNGMGS